MPGDLLFTVIGNTATRASSVSLVEAGLRERRDLQEWILTHPGILGEDIMVVTFEFDRWWASGSAPADRLDVLGLGSDGRLVVAELKRDKAPDTVEMQAVKYAAMASRFTPEALSSHHARFLSQRGEAVSEDEALQRLVTHAGDLDIENLRRPRIVIVAGEFPPVVTATTVWLTEMGLDITLVQVKAYRTAHETLIHVSQLFPVPDVEEFTVSPRQAEVKAVEERRRRQRDVGTTERLVAAQVLTDGTLLSLRPEGINSDVRASLDAWLEKDRRRAQARWFNTKGTPLTWEADGKRYSPSGLAVSILREAAGVERSVRGGDWWVTEDGRDLVEIAGELASPRQRLYAEFWNQFAQRVQHEHSDWVASRGQPTEWNWFEMASPHVKNSYYAAAFMHGRRIKYELYLDTGDAEHNKRSLNQFLPAKSDIEKSYGGPLEWHPPDQAHRYAAIRAIGEGDITELERHAEFMDWFIDAGQRLRSALETDLRGGDGPNR
jgi:Domain of unknown function (DUF4268)